MRGGGGKGGRVEQMGRKRRSTAAFHAWSQRRGTFSPLRWSFGASEVASYN